MSDPRNSTRSEVRGRRFAPVFIVIAAVGTLTVPEVPAQTPTFRLVGFSQTTARGDTGILHLNGICHSEFPGSRMCTSAEVVATVDPPMTINSNFAWVHTTIVASSGYFNSLFDTTGKLLSLDQAVSPNCDGWSYPNTTTVAITTDTGAAILRSCADANRVACCGRFTHTIFADGFEDGSTGSWSSTGE